MRLEKPCLTMGGRKEDGRPRQGDTYLYRAVYAKEHGPIPKGYVVHHKCDNPACVEITHLEIMTQGRHLMLHGISGDNHQRYKTHCPQGHAYNEENTYHWRGERHCRICRAEAKQRYNAKRRKPPNPKVKAMLATIRRGL